MKIYVANTEFWNLMLASSILKALKKRLYYQDKFGITGVVVFRFIRPCSFSDISSKGVTIVIWTKKLANNNFNMKLGKNATITDLLSSIVADGAAVFLQP